MEDRLKYIFGLVNDWLKFAETKNAALLVAVCALLVPVADHFPSNEGAGRCLCIAGCAMLVGAGIISLCSFIPQLTFSWSGSNPQPSASDNLFFFEHIARYSPVEFLQALYDAQQSPSPQNKIEADLAGQAVINSRIAVKKFRQFKTAAWIALLGFVLLGASAAMESKVFGS